MLRRITVHHQKSNRAVHVCAGGRKLFRNELVTENHQSNYESPACFVPTNNKRGPGIKSGLTQAFVAARQVDISRRRQSPRQLKI